MGKPYLSFSKPVENPEIVCISLGAGVQSTVMALMAEAGEIGPRKPDCAIFSDTQWEPQAVYDHLDWLTEQLSFPVYRVTAGNLREHVASERPKGKFLRVDIPAYVRGPNGPGGMVNRSCTQDYKIKPIQKQLRALLNLAGKRSPPAPVVEQWIGISTDEIQRMTRSRERWISHRWPLIEAGMNRGDCRQWFDARYPGRALAKSACIGCPFHSNEEWRRIAADPVQWADAVEIDTKLRAEINGKRARGRGELFLHRDCVPLDQANIDTQDRGEGLDGMGQECKGMCGV